MNFCNEVPVLFYHLLYASIKEAELKAILNELSPTELRNLVIHAATVLKAEQGIKEQYGLDDKCSLSESGNRQG
ncbi:MAG: hypothetical protein LBG93_07775 [Treponema sp.]|jgi:hypothetical protein|nr:hypothetical protein [Treponema sp.]